MDKTKSLNFTPPPPLINIMRLESLKEDNLYTADIPLEFILVPKCPLFRDSKCIIIISITIPSGGVCLLQCWSTIVKKRAENLYQYYVFVVVFLSHRITESTHNICWQVGIQGRGSSSSFLVYSGSSLRVIIVVI